MANLIQFLNTNKDAALAFAAIFAVFMSGITTFFSFLGIIYQKRIEIRMKENDAIRKLFDESLNELGAAAYEVLAQASILIKKYKKKKENSPKEFLESTERIKQKISLSKHILTDSKFNKRYTLLGIEGSFQKIARIGDWVKNLETDIATANKLVSIGTKLRKVADKTIINMYRYGILPTKIALLKNKYYCWRIDRCWEKSRRKYLETKEKNSEKCKNGRNQFF